MAAARSKTLLPHKKRKAVENGEIRVLGARVHNLKNIDVNIPRNNLVVITGLSGSGKSSLAFDTIYAEGQRRYMETLSAYARQFLGNMERPDVDKITGLSPVISIEQKTTSKNPRSTVGTITEIYDFLRLLFARAGIAYSYNTGEPMVKYTDEQIIGLIMEKFRNRKVYLLAPMVKGRKGHYKELFEQIRRKGFLNVRIDGELVEIRHGMKVDRYKTHFIEIVIDKLEVLAKDKERLKSSVSLAMQHGKGILMVLEAGRENIRYFSRQLMCPTTGISYNEPAPHTFSFNSPQGACQRCNGLGTINEVDIGKIIPKPELSIKKGGIQPLGPYKHSLIFWQMEAIARKYHFTLNTPIRDIPEDGLNVILYGSEETFKLENTPIGLSTNYFLSFEGIVNYVANHQEGNGSENEKWADQFIRKVTCPECKGARLKKEALHFRIHDRNIFELSSMEISELYRWFNAVDEYLTDRQRKIGTEIIKELKSRIKFLLDVGLDYLSLNRSSGSLSGGESQRIRLATQIGSELVNVLYILDEPSIGLHQRDNHRLIQALKELRDSGNSVIVVEHDREMILNADYIVDLGPFAGKHGGKLCVAGTPAEVMNSNSLTAQYLKHDKVIKMPSERRKGNGKSLILRGVSGNNLKKIDVEFPLGKFICITGVSGSGKSTLVYDTLYPVLSRHFYRSSLQPLPYEGIEGLSDVDKVIEVDQAPIGRTPRSNPATYTGVFSDIRKLFEQTREAKIRGYKAGRFSFNVKGGRCEVCQGAGVQTIEMNFLPDVYVECSVCNGRRYNRETLEVRYKGKNISDVLDMTINQAVEFFENIPSILKKLVALKQVGLGYVTLGQPSTTLSGGESQRVKLAAELAKKDTGKTVYILDEPTTGLHFEDIRVLLEVLNRLVDKGNTVIVIEHNMEVIKVADHIIDLGPEGGARGGEIICAGSPEEVSLHPSGYTARFLKQELELSTFTKN
ncbi:MAG: excinuclease ABC subunit UvrA [Bacteroidales bacterium]|nr:excinuclease ABC subunit UvrA [Bacteroidales bacterium]